MLRRKHTEPGTLERLQVPFMEIRATDQGALSGYGSVFNNVDWYKERIAPGAFADTLAAHAKAGTMPALLWQHSARKRTCSRSAKP
jgi:phage head maturation protease